MPRPRSPRAGSDGSDEERVATSYRIERFDATPSSTELMVTSRSKRSTAGNRLAALLDQELDKDDVFAEVENDVDFQADDHDAIDIVDSDFDRDSDDAPAHDDDSEGERELEAQEKADKQKRRATARAVGIVKRPPPPVRAAPAAKKRRISFAPDEPASPSTAAAQAADRAEQARSRRSSARASTVQSKLQVESRLEEATQRKAAMPARTVQKRRERMTQDRLIAEALEVEEENRESLRRFLEQEEERRAKQRQRKERITGPFVRWVSVGLKTRVVRDITSDTVKPEAPSAGVAPSDGQQQRPSATAQAGPADTAAAGVSNDKPAEPSGGQDQAVQTRSQEQDTAMQDAASSTNKAEAARRSERTTATPPFATSTLHAAETHPEPVASSAGLPPGTLLSAGAPDESPARTDLEGSGRLAGTASSAAVAGGSGASAVASGSALTLDPVYAARAQSAAQRTGGSVRPASSGEAEGVWERQARTVLSVERQPEDWEWLDEFQALLGGHCAWDAYAYVPHRNRPLRPRQSICPITGLPAIYKDPRTGIAYANKLAYATITNLLHNRYIWTSTPNPPNPPIPSRDTREGKDARGKGAGVVPVSSGIYVDHETEAGPGGVWNKARSKMPRPKSTPASTTTTPTASRTTSAKRTGGSEAVERETSNNHTESESHKQSHTQTQQPREKRTKPGFDLVLTNALAPGDEKALLAHALSLPPGSTRSGRRVHRP